MFKIDYNLSKNRIYVILEGHTTEEVEAYVREMKRTVDRANSECTICFDVTKHSVNTPESLEKLKELKDYTEKKGYKKSAMILSSAVYKMQARRAYGQAAGNDKDGVFETLAEAEKFLDA